MTAAGDFFWEANGIASTSKCVTIFTIIIYVTTTLVNPTPEDYRQAAARIGALAGQCITLFDATVAVLATRLNLEVWTYDHHFDVMRVAVWR